MSTKADTTGLEYQSPEWFEALAAIERGRREGRKAQYRPHGCGWQDKERPSYSGGHCGNYRLAPEPRERWIAVHSDGSEEVFTAKPELRGPVVDVYKASEVIK